jgi:hypothetical protein
MLPNWATWGPFLAFLAFTHIDFPVTQQLMHQKIKRNLALSDVV